MKYKTDKILNERMKTLGEVYLSSGTVASTEILSGELADVDY
jgi:hypothetical protein